MKNAILATSTSLLILIVGGSARGETLESVEKKINDEVAKQKTFRCKTKTTIEMTTEYAKMKIDSDGTLEYTKKGDKWLMRMEGTSRTVRQNKDEKEVKEESKSLMIMDGEFSYTLTESGGKKSASKSKLLEKQDYAKFNFAKSYKDYVLKLLPDETVDGNSVYVIEMKPKKTDENSIQRMVICYRKDNGIGVKSVTYDNKGKLMQTYIASDIKINGDIGPDRFVFKAPPGVEVVDMDKMNQQQQSGDQKTPMAENKKEDQPTASAKEKDKDEEPAPKEEKKKSSGVKSLLNRLK